MSVARFSEFYFWNSNALSAIYVGNIFSHFVIFSLLFSHVRHFKAGKGGEWWRGRRDMYLKLRHSLR